MSKNNYIKKLNSGLFFEKKVISLLKKFYIEEEKYSLYKIISFKGYPWVKVIYLKNKFREYMFKSGYLNKNVIIAHGCKQPDEVYIIDKLIFILEIKIQNTKGSVVEKLQTGVFKQNHYEKIYPNFEIVYIYILSSWFEENAISELIFLKENLIPVFFIHKKNWELKLIEFMLLRSGKISN